MESIYFWTELALGKDKQSMKAAHSEEGRSWRDVPWAKGYNTLNQGMEEGTTKGSNMDTGL